MFESFILKDNLDKQIFKKYKKNYLDTKIRNQKKKKKTFLNNEKTPKNYFDKKIKNPKRKLPGQ